MKCETLVMEKGYRMGAATSAARTVPTPPVFLWWVDLGSLPEVHPADLSLLSSTGGQVEES